MATPRLACAKNAIRCGERHSAPKKHPLKGTRGNASSVCTNHTAKMKRANRVARVSRMDELQIVKRRLVLQQWKLLDTTHARTLINVYDTASYAFEEKAYDELTDRIDKEIDILFKHQIVKF